MITEVEVRDTLKRFPLYHTGHTVLVGPSPTKLVPGAVFVSYRTTKGDHHGKTHLSLQFEGSTCYLVGIGLEPMYRGVGLGKELYGIAEKIARQVGSMKVVMTPSGKTSTGETRKDYVKKLGYREIPNSIEVEKIL